MHVHVCHLLNSNFSQYTTRLRNKDCNHFPDVMNKALDVAILRQRRCELEFHWSRTESCCDEYFDLA